MTHYPDASVIVSAFTDEVGSALAEAWLTSLDPGELRTSAWCETEVAFALSMKVRSGNLAVHDRQPLFELIQSTLAKAASTVPVERRHFQAATALLLQSGKTLRGGDALHLAIAADIGATLWTYDRKMAAAGSALDVDARLLS